MSSDADYAAFLDKANQDTGGGDASAKGASDAPARSKAVNAAVPQVLQAVEEYYVSDADEPFEPVSLKWDGDGFPGKDEFAKLIGQDAEADEVKQKEFDPQGSYGKVLDAVKEAGNGSFRIYKIQLAGTRAEYFVVSVDKKGGRLVGLMALAVES